MQPDERPALLADVSGVPLADLFPSDDSVLGVAIRRVVDGAEVAAQAISGWSSFVDNRRNGEEVAGG